MKAALIWQKDTKVFVEEGTLDSGTNLTICAPEGQNPPEVVWEENENISDGIHLRREFECDVKDRVWVEKWKVPDKAEYEFKFVHKDVLKRGFTPQELKLLNAYQNRFLLLVVVNKCDCETKADYYIWDNNTKVKYLTSDLLSNKLEEIKEYLEKVELI